jgi:hypothetical protein
MIGYGPTVWSYKKQKNVSLSTTKVEYRGVVNDCVDYNLMCEMIFYFQESTVVYCDNRITIEVVDNSIVHSEMKHVDLHAYYLRQLVQ